MSTVFSNTAVLNPMKQSQRTAADRIALFGIQIDRLTMSGAVNSLVEVIQSTQRPSNLVVTPNIDHVIMLQANSRFRDAYLSAFLVLADGKPVVWASRLLGVPLPETVPGSDLVPALFAALTSANIHTKVFLFGAAPGVAVTARDNIIDKWGSAIEVVGTTSPDFGFEHDAKASEIFENEIAKSRADILVIGLGAPKQELWAYAHRERLGVKVVLCVGATIDFLAGAKRRAPRWMQRAGIEWFFRMCQEPKRLVRRYAKGAYTFPILVIREVFQRSRL